MRAWLTALRLPGARLLLTGGLLARVGFGAFTLPALLLLAERFGGFTVPGLALAGYGVAAGVLAPVRGRFVDRRGRPGLVGLTLAFGVLLAPAPWLPAGLPWLLVLVATAAGALAPPVTAAVRRGWSSLLSAGESVDEALRTAAFSADSVVEELCFVAGPALAALGIATVGSAATFLGALGLVVAGGLVVARVALGPGAETREQAPTPLTGRARAVVARVTLSVAALGLIGLVDTAVPALMLERGQPALSGVLLALYTVGSVLGVLVASARPTALLDRRRVRLGLAMIVVVLPLVVVRAPLPLALALLVAGLPIGPLLVTSYLQIDREVPLAAATQAYAWAATASNLLASLAMAVGGVLVDAYGPGLVLALTPVFAVATGVPAALLHRRDLARGVVPA